uniref:Protein-serine O-palmitoleoyltransferase porcupine n=1 Tax=Amblyomma parvum TaxID=251391 RepID=A0A023FXI7_AMBPA
MDFDYEDEGFTEDDYLFDDEETGNDLSLSDLYTHCLVPTLQDGIRAGALLLPSCFLLRTVVSARLLSAGGLWIHTLSALLGLFCLWNLVGSLTAYVAGLALLGTALLTGLHKHRGLACASLVTVFVIACELKLVEPKSWHKIRGCQMVLCMKLVSLAVDLDRGRLGLPGPVAMLGYLLHVATAPFGPWVGYESYSRSLEPTISASLGFGPWLLALGRSLVLSYTSLTISVCWSAWLLSNTLGLRWLAAYRDALAFRFSHYFISFLSEASAVAAGISHDGSWSLQLCSPLDVELPRSLVQVVVYWNRAMHTWLKHYVFQVCRPSLGNLGALLLTYAASALLHGLNFQLAAVLLSLALYSYAEYVLRQKLSQVYSACVGARPCRPGCEKHKLQANNWGVRGANLALGLLAAFHLAYLGLMFDNESHHEQGYSMQHTLGKWSELQFASHWVALATFIIYLLI